MGLKGKIWLRLVIYFTAFPIILLYVLVVAGCVSVSPGIPNLYILSLISPAAGQLNDAVQVRIGYFGLCIGTSASTFTCGGTAGLDTEGVLSRLQIHANGPTKALVQLALELQGNILLYLIVIGGIVFLFAAVSITAWKVNGKRENSAERAQMLLKRGTVTFLWTSTAICLASTISITQVSNALHWYNQIVGASYAIQQGKTVEAIQWTLCVVSAIFACGMTFLLSNELPVEHNTTVKQNPFSAPKGWLNQV